MLGGDILSTRNLTQGTLFEVLQKPLDATDRPLDMDRTEGRFMALCEGYLDPEVYAVWSTAWLAHMWPNCRAAWTGVQLKLEGGVREDYRSTSISPVAPATAAELDGARNQLRSNLDPG
jgi:hypothetical protein